MQRQTCVSELIFNQNLLNSGNTKFLSKSDTFLLNHNSWSSTLDSSSGSSSADDPKFNTLKKLNKSQLLNQSNLPNSQSSSLHETDSSENDYEYYYFSESSGDDDNTNTYEQENELSSGGAETDYH